MSGEALSTNAVATVPEEREREQLAKKIALAGYTDEQIARWVAKQAGLFGAEYADEMAKRIAIARTEAGGLEPGQDRARSALAVSLVENYSELERAEWFKRWKLPECKEFVTDIRKRVNEIMARGIIKPKASG